MRTDRLEWIRSQCKPTDKIVDIGSNRGHTFENWQNKENVTNVDIDLYDTWNFVQADASRLPFEDEEFDVAVLAEILEHVPDPIAVIQEARRVAKRLIITVPNEYEWEEEAKPFHGIREWEDETGKSRYDIAKEGNDPIEFFDGDNLEHLWHVRYYQEDTLKEDLKKAGLENVEFANGTDDFFHWFLINAS
jgi:ubiquinone/menaquinone biosynthesis C-methylase UbiE